LGCRAALLLLLLNMLLTMTMTTQHPSWILQNSETRVWPSQPIPLPHQMRHRLLRAQQQGMGGQA
jgi:hypothetical protein